MSHVTIFLAPMSHITKPHVACRILEMAVSNLGVNSPKAGGARAGWCRPQSVCEVSEGSRITLSRSLLVPQVPFSSGEMGDNLWGHPLGIDICGVI